MAQITCYEESQDPMPDGPVYVEDLRVIRSLIDAADHRFDVTLHPDYLTPEKYHMVLWRRNSMRSWAATVKESDGESIFEILNRLLIAADTSWRFRTPADDWDPYRILYCRIPSNHPGMVEWALDGAR